MLADQLDYVVGVDPHRDAHAVAVVEVRTGAVVFETTVAASGEGYAQALRLVAEQAVGRRAFAVEGSGSFGAGLTRFLSGRGERVLEVSRLRRQRGTGGKSDALDAIRAARSVLGSERPATPRAGGERQALQALVAAREGAVTAKRAGLCQLRDLLITTPEPLRSELRPLSRARLLRRLAATRPAGRGDPELRGSLLALRSIARRVLQLTGEERELAHARSKRSRASSHRSCSPSRASDHTPPRSYCSPGRTPAASTPKPPSPDSPAPPRSPPPPAKQSATASTAQATANSTAPSTPSSSPANAHSPPRSPTSNADSQKAKHAAKQTAASSATSPATSTGSSSRRQRPLDFHRSNQVRGLNLVPEFRPADVGAPQSETANQVASSKLRLLLRSPPARAGRRRSRGTSRSSPSARARASRSRCR